MDLVERYREYEAAYAANGDPEVREYLLAIEALLEDYQGDDRP